MDDELLRSPSWCTLVQDGIEANQATHEAKANRSFLSHDPVG
jgi:hypothetical protein